MLKIYLILFCSFFLNLSAEVIQKLEIKGNNRISDETIKVYGEITIDKNYSNNDVNEILKNLYNTNFFEDIKISLNNGILDISVKEYAIIYSIDLDGEDSKTIKKFVLEQLALKDKESFIKNLLEQDVSQIRKIYASI